MLLYETKNAWYGIHANKEDNTIIAIMKYDKTTKKAVCHTYKVKEDSEYTYKIQRTQIKAIDGVHGLIKHFAECVNNDFAIKAWFIDPIENILQNVKPIL